MTGQLLAVDATRSIEIDAGAGDHVLVHLRGAAVLIKNVTAAIDVEIDFVFDLIPDRALADEIMVATPADAILLTLPKTKSVAKTRRRRPSIRRNIEVKITCPTQIPGANYWR